MLTDSSVSHHAAGFLQSKYYIPVFIVYLSVTTLVIGVSDRTLHVC